MYTGRLKIGNLCIAENNICLRRVNCSDMEAYISNRSYLKIRKIYTIEDYEFKKQAQRLFACFAYRIKFSATRYVVQRVA